MPDQARNIFHQSVLAMNTVLDIVFWGIPSRNGNTIVEKIQLEISNLEETISRYSTTSELYSLNLNAKVKPQKVSIALWDALRCGMGFYKTTNGYFDISLGKYYHQLKTFGENNVQCNGSLIDHIETNETERMVCFKHPDISIDFGAVGKGMALAGIDKILLEMDIENAFISFGGSSFLIKGRHPHGPYWPLQLANFNQGFNTLQLNNHAVSISSSVRETPNGNTYHIFNPSIGKPIMNRKIVVVQNSNPIHAEVLSTALLVAPAIEHNEILKNFEEIHYQIIQIN
jgi:thiamine biosynthesis lipoprotein ApbE